MGQEIFLHVGGVKSGGTRDHTNGLTIIGDFNIRQRIGHNPRVVDSGAELNLEGCTGLFPNSLDVGHW